MKHSSPTAEAPRTIRRSVEGWFVAIGAGLFETCVIVADATSKHELDAGIAAGVAVRALIFLVMTYVVLRLRDGRAWARIVLSIVLSFLGLLSLVIGPITWLADHDHSLVTAAQDASAVTWLFFVSRCLHVFAVIYATVVMWHRDSSSFLKTR